MDFVTAVKTCLTEKYATFSGRASRSEFWWFMIFVIISWLVVTILGAAIGVRLLSLLYLLALIWPTTAAGFRRLQDMGRPGWIILFPLGTALLLLIGVPLYVIQLVASIGPDGPQTNLHIGLPSVVLIILTVQLVVSAPFIYWLTRPSEPETNAYGPPPQA
ncbi:MAG: DUF805 domain-containing protein [Roseovarius sp.]|nr:DUF805 domain-containing protein [Roseovarius sp.]